MQSSIRLAILTMPVLQLCKCSSNRHSTTTGGQKFPGTVYFISFSYPSASRFSSAVNSYRLVFLAALQNHRLLMVGLCANAIHSLCYHSDQTQLNTPASCSNPKRLRSLTSQSALLNPK